MTPLETGLLFLGILLGCLVVANVRDWPPFRITKTPPAVRMDPEVIRQWRSEVVHHAAKRPHAVRPGFQKGNHS